MYVIRKCCVNSADIPNNCHFPNSNRTCECVCESVCVCIDPHTKCASQLNAFNIIQFSCSPARDMYSKHTHPQRTRSVPAPVHALRLRVPFDRRQCSVRKQFFGVRHAPPQNALTTVPLRSPLTIVTGAYVTCPSCRASEAYCNEATTSRVCVSGTRAYLIMFCVSNPFVCPSPCACVSAIGPAQS